MTKTVALRSVRRRGLGAAWLLPLVVLAPTFAFGGDPPAHQEAARRASLIVAKQFPNGVGAPEFVIDPNALWSAGMPIGQSPVNVPDLFGCEDTRQPAAVTSANDAIVGSFLGSITTQLNLAYPMLGGLPYPVAMACNFNHFVNNEALQGASSQAADITPMYQAQLLADFGRGARCSVLDWQQYWERVLYGLHFLQDQLAEQHLIGNRWCTGSSAAFGLAAAGPVGVSFRFAKTAALAAAGALGTVVDDSCQDFLASGVAASAGGKLDCDSTITGGGLAVLSALCLSQDAPPACMGLERLLRHHCYYLGDRPQRAVHCSGPLALQCERPNFTCVHPTAETDFCEGELCLGGGVVDYVSAATGVSVPYLTEMANHWAGACACSGHKCPPDQVCMRCGGATDSCEPAGGQCCGTSVCSVGRECCTYNGKPACVTTGACCGGNLCSAGEICLNCSPDAGANDAGMKDAGMKDASADSTCPPATQSSHDAGGGVTGQPGTCVPMGTVCPMVDSGPTCKAEQQPCSDNGQCCDPANACNLPPGGSQMLCCHPDGTSCGGLLDGGSNSECCSHYCPFGIYGAYCCTPPGGTCIFGATTGSYCCSGTCPSSGMCP